MMIYSLSYTKPDKDPKVTRTTIIEFDDKERRDSRVTELTKAGHDVKTRDVLKLVPVSKKPWHKIW